MFPQKFKRNNKYVVQSPAIAMKIFEDLAAINQEKNSKLVVVYLPSRSDYYNNNSDFWRKYLQAELQKRNIIYIDLIAEFRDKIPNEQLGKAFLGGDKWHYSVSGNKFIANILYGKLLSLPEVAVILQQ
ncbi:MAG: SGNH/GDSL hydrolase family protein [Trichodesmium sp. MO_231.B1]|nr:SGNH/GDSL hydrolase family protein [Trichodesmium sp. MO_231.B1]